MPLLKKEIEDISVLTQKFKKVLNKYEKQLQKAIEMDHWEVPAFREADFTYAEFFNSKGLVNASQIERILLVQVQNAEEFVKTISKHFSQDGEDTFHFGNEIFYFYNWSNFEFEIKYVDPKLSDFEQKFIKIDYEALKKEIAKLNTALKKSKEEVMHFVKEINERVDFFKNAFQVSDITIPGKNYYLFLREIQQAVNRNFLFLKNENTIIFKEENRESFYPNEANLILDAYLKKIYKGESEKPSNEIVLTAKEQKKFEKYLNENIPTFDKEMYSSISVRYVERNHYGERNHLEILLHENTGDIVSLNSTSAGRRWYYTYYFMKNSLEKGDVFIIDEPAALLHPLAQKEVFRELRELHAEKGITVIYSTHSPYLIPEKFQSLHFVSMGANGTETKAPLNDSEVLAQSKDVFRQDVFELQYLYEAYEKTDTKKLGVFCAKKIKEHAEKEADRNFDFKELAISQYTVESWKKGKRCPSFENVLRIAKITQTDIEEFFA